jgi:Na+/H+-translocating membrane pyrophosphatase
MVWRQCDDGYYSDATGYRAFGPISDNAGGMAEMVSRTYCTGTYRHSDAVGNTTAATGKGFAIASLAVTSSTFAAYVTFTD